MLCVHCCAATQLDADVNMYPCRLPISGRCSRLAAEANCGFSMRMQAVWVLTMFV